MGGKGGGWARRGGARGGEGAGLAGGGRKGGGGSGLEGGLGEILPKSLRRQRPQTSESVRNTFS